VTRVFNRDLQAGKIPAPAVDRPRVLC
jgi:hypothetical protein